MVERSEVSGGSDITFGVAYSIEVVDVLEVTGTFFALGRFPRLFKEVTRALLSHDNSHPFVSWIRSKVLPSFSNPTRKRETSSSAGLPQLIDAKVSIFTGYRFDPRSIVMEWIDPIEVATLAGFIAFLHHVID